MTEHIGGMKPKIAVTSGTTTRVGPIDECTGGTSGSDSRSSTHAKESCCDTPVEEEKERKKATKEDRENGRTDEEGAEVGESTEATGIERKAVRNLGRPKRLGKRSSQPKTNRRPRTQKSPATSQEGRG
ncbi:hypothetical protein NDU88_003529 [Pleurodeles waltl]|uniref:Uncharacterized protein n=1 Tax=Pleurodeles waltl TaxID=8319 RepID=A0AAV7W787_PLEWA|nr:hypothetical protein NDU88_003529 [Pleurodeles waltl]